VAGLSKFLLHLARNFGIERRKQQLRRASRLALVYGKIPRALRQGSRKRQLHASRYVLPADLSEAASHLILNHG